MLKTVLVYGLVALAAGAVALQWLEYKIWARDERGYGLRRADRRWIPGGRTGWVAGCFAASRAPADLLRTSARKPRSASPSVNREVLQLLADGRSNKEIARRLELSPNTVKTHVARLFEKLQVARRTEVILRARELELVP